jgi:hypothetical protein
MKPSIPLFTVSEINTMQDRLAILVDEYQDLKTSLEEDYFTDEEYSSTIAEINIVNQEILHRQKILFQALEEYEV